MTRRTLTRAALKRIRRIVPPPAHWVLTHVVCRVPLARHRMAWYARSGVAFEDHRTGIIMLGSEISSPEKLQIGLNTAIGKRCVIDARGGITIGRNVNISSYVRLQTAKHLIDDPDFTHQYSPISIGDRVWIAEGAIVLGGVTIGEGAVVAASAVVTKDVEPFSVVGGVPARVIRQRSHDLRYHLSWRPDWM
jgi:acetyltransferase-like isoleucine patch superfamily enzyme